MANSWLLRCQSQQSVAHFTNSLLIIISSIWLLLVLQGCTTCYQSEAVIFKRYKVLIKVMSFPTDKKWENLQSYWFMITVTITWSLVTCQSLVVTNKVFDYCFEYIVILRSLLIYFSLQYSSNTSVIGFLYSIFDMSLLTKQITSL